MNQNRPISELNVGQKFVSTTSMDQTNDQKAKYYEKLTSLFAETRQKIMEYNQDKSVESLGFEIDDDQNDALVPNAES